MSIFSISHLPSHLCDLLTSYAAVGMLCFFMKSLEKALEPSICAALGEGPKQGIPTGGGGGEINQRSEGVL